MIKVAFCDDEPVILEQITALLEKYKEQRCRDMEYAAFRSPLELLAEMENGLHPADQNQHAFRRQPAEGHFRPLDFDAAGRAAAGRDHARRERHQRRTGDTAV